MGLDVGSTTVKLVLLDGDQPVYETYRRHHADISGELDEIFTDVLLQFPQVRVVGAVTGSGGLGVSQALELPFVQEVIAETEAIRRFDPAADVVIELGGEDAKITYLKPVPEQRMNGTCAGGTGAFIDQMATLLHTDPPGLDALAQRYTTLYPIASRCGVFAKTDLQPLINEGAPHEDLAASIFTAVAQQTIAGLACGRPIRGTVVFLGGPLYFLPQLREAYRRLLGDQVSGFVTPDRAQLYVAIGAALLATGAPRRLEDVVAAARGRARVRGETQRMAPLFADDQARADFDRRHRAVVVPRADIGGAEGDCFLGIDAGSTTIKAVLLDRDAKILYSHYAGNEGDPVGNAVAILAAVRQALPAAARIARTCVTGYGEGLVKAAVKADEGEIETMAHYRAAEHVCPGVTSVIDIGGQDMKYLRVRDGAIDSICVNEACSSGCGSFLQTFAVTMGADVSAFSALGLAATDPVDLGSRCTVFMNSSVKQAQKEGAGVGDISAGLSYSVVRNALYKVIKVRDPEDLGDKVVVQGGTFLNDAVLRAFELLTGREVVRPDIAGLMGAFGAALIARSRHDPGASATRLLDLTALHDFSVQTEKSPCRQCQNHCQRTISTFNDGERFVSGNRCDRGASPERTRGRRPRSALPNVVEQKYQRVFGYRRLTEDAAFRGDIGIPRALNMYENYPFWFTVLTRLGYRVLLSGRSSHDLFESGMESIPSENVCYPAKLAHGHVVDLVEKGVRTIFYPCVPYEQPSSESADGHYNCPVVTSYPEVIKNNVEQLRDHDVRLVMPFLNLADHEALVTQLTQAFAGDGVTRAEMADAVAAGYAEDAAVRADIREMGLAALRYVQEHRIPGIVLAGRPYHIDPEVNHGIPDLINSLGMAVLTEDCIADPKLLERPLRIRDQWAYHSRLFDAAAFVASQPELELVQLNSFGCGLDAITTDQVEEILKARNRVYTTLKIDEVSNLGAARIRLRSLQAARRERADVVAERPVGSHVHERVPFTVREAHEHTLVMPQMAPMHVRLLAAVLRRSGHRVHLLEHVSRDDVEVGLKHVNNDACFPALMVIGQMLHALQNGELDPDRSTLLITQTGGMCRATNYAAMLRKALADAGLGHVPVLALSATGLETNPGFSLSVPMVHRIVQSLVLADVLQTVVHRVRPYEVEPGAADALYARWDAVAQEFFTEHGWSPTLGRRVGYRWLIERIVAEFAALPTQDIPRKPRVGIVGEILVRLHPDANNHAVRVVESEGCEAVLPGLVQFVLNSLYTGDWNWTHLGVGQKARHVKRALRYLIERYQAPARRALARAEVFDVPLPIETMAQLASDVVSLGNQAGEGWLLTGEMIGMLHEGVPNLICAQPFACLPNHVTGKGVFHEIRRRYPQANLVAVDYDPGASEVNQLNRIKLMLSTALSRHATPHHDDLDPGESPAEPTDQPSVALS